MTTRHTIYMPLGQLVPAERNPKLHDLASICESLTRFGWTEPIVLDERTGRMVAGHGRREACIVLKQAGDPPPAGVVPDDDGDWLVPVSRGWESRTDAEAEAYIYASNHLSEIGGWHMRDLAEMLEDVVTTDASLLDATGLTFEGLDEMLRRIDPETIGPEDPDNPRTGASDPDPHMALSGDDETVEECEACEAGRVCLRHSTGVIGVDDLDGQKQMHTCPACGHESEV